MLKCFSLKVSKRRTRGGGGSTRGGLEEGFLPGVWSLPLRLPCDGVHDRVLRVHADGRVVLGVDDGGLAAGALHLDGLVGGEGGVQSAGAEAGADVGRVVRERKRREGWRRRGRV